MAKTRPAVRMNTDAEAVIASGEPEYLPVKGDPGAAAEDDRPEPSETFPWFSFVANHDDAAIVAALREAFAELLEEYGAKLGQYKVVALFDAEGTISRYSADRLYTALLSDKGRNEKRDVLLLLLSKGGSVEPAYQISKLCRAYSGGKFAVAVPREAKSAATLIAIGADEIHMGPLSHLGPIDPQLGNLPALGVVQALETIAALAEKFPGSWEMLSRYLQRVLTVEQIGYCQRISESAMQYAERLLLTKRHLQESAKKIAKELVYEYKDHGFVIDLEEAREHLGESWILSDTPEAEFADKIYKIYEEVDLGLRYIRGKYLSFVGDVIEGFMIFKLSR